MPSLLPEIILPKTEVFEARGIPMLARARKLATIHTDEDLRAAEGELKIVAGLDKAIVTAFEEPARLADKAHKAITSLREKLRDYPRQARKILEDGIRPFRAEQDKKRREEELRLQAEAKRQAEDDRLAQAQALAETGHQAEAEALLDQPVTAPVVQLERPKSEGVSTRRKWAYRLVDISKVRPEFLCLDEKKVGALVRSVGPDAVGMVGGIEVVEESIISVRSNG